MTNGEKFKTAEERIAGWREYCKKHYSEDKNCSECPLWKLGALECRFPWLELEYKEDLRLEPCPFCGRTPVMENNVDSMRSLSYYVKCACGARFASALSESVAVEQWNRRAK